MTAPSETPSPTPSQDQASGLAGGATGFYGAPNSANVAVQQLRDAGRDDDAALIERIASQPIGTWLQGTTPDLTGTVATITAEAAAQSEIALFVIYNIPGRDCGLYSAGGAAEDEYLGWVDQVAAGLSDGAAVWAVLEPDALPQLGDCDGQGDRTGLLAGAARVLDGAGVKVFLDVGHSQWQSVEEMAARARQVGLDHLSGFATNTSNYNTTDQEREWGDRLSVELGLPYIVDTSRNGNGSTGEWCNPRGRALGVNPALTGSDEGFAATVWTKVPGESDGTCNGGPAAGQWWEEIALELARNAS